VRNLIVTHGAGSHLLQYFQLPILSFVFKVAGAVPIASRKEAPDTFDAAFEKSLRLA